MAVADLPALRDAIAARLATIEAGAENAEALARATAAARADYVAAAERVSRGAREPQPSGSMPGSRPS